MSAPERRTEHDDDSGPFARRLLAGRYRLGRRLGTGGMAEIFDAEDVTMKRPVAIKLSRSRQRARFDGSIWREAFITSRLACPHVVRVMDTGEDSERGYFMVMERLNGINLERLLALSGVLSVPVVCELACQVAATMERVHEAGVLHRDLKPANVFLVDTGDSTIFVKVLDFGVAKTSVIDRSGNLLQTLAPPGLTVGTPQYMSPEQARGEHLDERSDVYSLGAVLYEALCGEPALEVADCRSSGRVRVARRIPRLSTRVDGVGDRLDALVDEMLRVEREHRPRTMREVRERIRENRQDVRSAVTGRRR
jgi:serine/threonine-protein kinase